MARYHRRFTGQLNCVSKRTTSSHAFCDIVDGRHLRRLYRIDRVISDDEAHDGHAPHVITDALSALYTTPQPSCTFLRFGVLEEVHESELIRVYMACGLQMSWQ